MSATVELARVVLGDGRAKFVNAVLRKIAQHDLDGWLERVAPPYDDDPEDHLAVVHSHPRWVVSALWDALGGGRAGIEDLLEADNERPEVTLVARPGRATAEELLLLGEEAALPGRWSPYAVRLAEGGEPGALEPVREGRAGVQDEGSQLVALALANAPAGGAGRRWLDGCAGPGGKAALLGRARRGARGRPARLREAAAPRTAGRAGAGRQPRPVPGHRRRRHPPAVAARRLRPGPVDVPCTGPGRAAPPARGPLAAAPRGPGRVRPAPARLLRRRWSAVRVGGVVGYATCSPHLAETRAVVDDVLKGRGGAHRPRRSRSTPGP